MLISKESSREYVVFHNLTSSSSCFDYETNRLRQLDEHSFSLICPKNMCALGHEIEFHFFEQKKRLELMKKMPENRVLLSANMMVTGKVESIHKVDEQLVELNISLLLYDKNQWDAYYKKYGWKQEKVNYLFDKFKI